MAELLDFSGRTVIVTGGCRGIGASIARRFMSVGAEVVVCCRHEPDQLPESGGRTVSFLAADVREPDDIARVVAFTTERFGRLDVLVNNAGGAPPADAATASSRFSSSVVSLNLLAPLEFSRQANAVMQLQATGGCIVNIGSVSALRPSPGAAAYGAAKAGLVSLARSLAVEWAPKVRVNTVSAGLIRTELAHLHYGDEESIAAVAATVPLGRMGDPEDVADACLYLASDLALYVSGENLVVHGGGERPAFLGAVSQGDAAV